MAVLRPGGPGRPHRPSRPLPGRPVPGSPERIAWLLRANRRYGPAGRDVRLATFAADLTAHGCPASAGQVSRWESGRMPVPHRAVVAYERALGLRRNSLVTIVDAVYRWDTPLLSASRLDRGISPDDPKAFRRAQELLDRAAGDGEMTAADWDEFTVLLTTFTNLLMPGHVWDGLAQRLLTEQLLADGDAWRQRSESTHRLLWLPVSRPHVVAACAALVRDPHSQIVIEPLVILDLVDDPAVTALLAAQLTAPANERALRGALMAGVAKVRYRRFGPAALRRVGAAAFELVADPGRPDGVRLLAAELLGRLPPRMRAEATRRLRKALADEPALAAAVTDGRSSDGSRSRAMVDRLASRVLAHTPAYVDSTPDELLVRMIDEMLFSTNADVRLHAAQLVGATPFRRALADACCAELSRPAVARDATLAAALLEVLPFTAGPEHRRTVEVMAAAPGLPAGTVTAAAWSIAHLPGRSSDAFWARALKGRGPWLRGLVYALGMTGRPAWLTRVRRDADMPAEARVAARWWLNIPAALTRAARR